MTPTQIAAIKGMLAYFDSGNNIPVDKAVIKGNCAEVAALRAALAETAPVQEPVGGLDDATRIGWAMWRIKDLEQQLASRPAYIAQQSAPPADVPMIEQKAVEPVGFVNRAAVNSAIIDRARGVGDTHTWSEKKTSFHSVPFYTSPQPAPHADVPMLTDDELTAIYKQENGEDVGKAQPLTTQRIFKAMRAVANIRQIAGLT